MRLGEPVARMVDYLAPERAQLEDHTLGETTFTLGRVLAVRDE
jgi:hypothetical protein